MRLAHRAEQVLSFVFGHMCWIVDVATGPQVPENTTVQPMIIDERSRHDASGAAKERGRSVISNEGSPHPDRLQKGTVAQRHRPRRVCKDLGVAKRYCRIKVIGNTVLQCWGYARVSTDDQDTAAQVAALHAGRPDDAEFERAMLREHTRTGVEAARQEGRVGGRPLTLSPQQQSEIRKYGFERREGSAYNGRFALVCYHPLLLFNSHGDCLAATLRRGNARSSEQQSPRPCSSTSPVLTAAGPTVCYLNQGSDRRA